MVDVRELQRMREILENCRKGAREHAEQFPSDFSNGQIAGLTVAIDAINRRVDILFEEAAEDAELKDRNYWLIHGRKD